MSNVYVKSIAVVVAFIVGLGALVFLSAWTLDYWQASVFLAVYGVAGLVIMLDLARRDRALLQRRMSGGPQAETRRSQRIIMSFASLGFFALLLLPFMAWRIFDEEGLLRRELRGYDQYTHKVRYRLLPHVW
jgi:membrane protease YdiL (CAAX protease family)